MSSPRISSRVLRACVAAIVASLPLVVACAAGPRGTAGVRLPDADVRSDFTRRLDGYMRLHHALQARGSPPAPTTNVGHNRASQQALATRIREARGDAQQGDILTPAFAAVLRTAMNPQLRGAAASGTRASIRDDAPVAFTLRVNAAYPDGASLSTVPPNVLNVLPRLPEDLEFRIVGTHLILLDVNADLVVDYIFNVMCARC